jgi:Zn ribbon nucleic-acid-binding protein
MDTIIFLSTLHHCASVYECYAFTACREHCSFGKEEACFRKASYPAIRTVRIAGCDAFFTLTTHLAPAPPPWHTSKELNYMAFRQQRDKRAMIFRTIVITVIVAVVGAIAAMRYQEKKAGPDNRVGLAECLTQKGVKMYGAYWCPHCQKQKKIFGKAFSKVDYVECAVPGNPQQQVPACQDAGITGYPTWVFASGDQPLKDLAEKAGCEFGTTVAPADTAAAPADAPASEAMPVNAEAPTEQPAAE